MGDDLRWAVMGTGMIARKVLPRIAAAQGCTVVCVASREIERARVFAGEMELPGTAACDDETMAGRDDVDAVYITAPNHLHGAWCVRLLKAGKHVLCEKPLTPFEDEARAIFDAAEKAAGGRGKIAVEGFMYMHHPQTAWLVAMVRQAMLPESAAPMARDHPIGPLVRMEGRFDINLVGVAHAWTRFLHSMWGGALMDLGCYPIGMSRLLTGLEPRVVAASAEWAEVPEGERAPVDLACAVELEYDAGGRRIPCSCHCSMGAAGDRRNVLFRIEGEWGSVETGHPFGPDPDRAVIEWTRNERHPKGAGREEIVFADGGERFENQAAAFARAARGEVAPMPSAEWSIGQARVLGEILERIGLTFER